MSDSTIELSSDSDEIDNYDDLDEFDDGAMFANNHSDTLVDLEAATDLDLITELEKIKELFGHLSANPVCRIHGDNVSLYIPFFNQLSKGLQLAWKDYEHSHIVVDIKVCLERYRRATELPTVTLVLSMAVTSPSMQLFCDHLRTIAQVHIREHFKNTDCEKNFLADLYKKLFSRIQNLSNYCCFCDRRLGEEGAFLPTFCSAPLCSFQVQFRRAHPTAGPGGGVFFHVLNNCDHFASLKHSRQALILHESPDQFADWERRRRKHGVRFLFLQNPPAYWYNLLRRSDFERRIFSQNFVCLSDVLRPGFVTSLLCEVIDDPTTLIHVKRHEYLLRDVRTLRFRVRLENPQEPRLHQLAFEEQLRLCNALFMLLQQGISDFSQDSEGTTRTFDLGALSNDALLRVLQMANQRDMLRLKRASRRFHDFIETNRHQLLMFKDVKMKLTRVTVDQKRWIRILFDNLLEYRLMEVLVEDQKNPTDEEMARAFYQEPQPQSNETVERQDFLSNRILQGAKEDGWRRLLFNTEGYSLREVLARLSTLIEITRVELENVYHSEVEVVLQVVPTIRELHIGEMVPEERIALRPLVHSLPPNLSSLSFTNTKLFHPDSLHNLFCNGRICHLNELHITGGGEAIADEIFLRLRVERLCLEHCEVSLEAMREVVREWRANEREIFAWTVEVVEELQMGLQPRSPPGFPGRNDPQRRVALTQHQIFLALRVDPSTSRIRRQIPENFELEVEISTRDSDREFHGKTLLQFLPHFL